MSGNFVDGAGKGFEPFARVKYMSLNRQTWVNDGRVLTETEVDDLSLLGERLLYVGCDEILVIFDAVDFPDDIVTDAQTIEDFIKTFESSCYPSFVHGHPLYRESSGKPLRVNSFAW